MPKWEPDPEQYQVVQLPGRPRYHLLKDRDELRAAIGNLIRHHERLVARSRIEETSAKEHPKEQGGNEDG